MSKLEDELLDYENEGGPHYTNNHLYSSVRYGLSALLAVRILRNLANTLGTYEGGGSESFAFFSGLLIPILIYAWFIYYNLVQGTMERKDQAIYPRFKRPFLILFLVTTLIIIVLNFPLAFQANLTAIITIICCAIILSREFQYFRMLS